VERKRRSECLLARSIKGTFLETVDFIVILSLRNGQHRKIMRMVDDRPKSSVDFSIDGLAKKSAGPDARRSSGRIGMMAGD
jgi:hypothetical protein